MYFDDIKKEYRNILEDIEDEIDVPTPLYYHWCSKAAGIANQRLSLSDPLEYQLMDLRDGLPGLHYIAHSIVTGFMGMPSDSRHFSQSLYPDLVRLFFIAGDFDYDYVDKAKEWFGKLKPAQLIQYPELNYLWWLYHQNEEQLNLFKQHIQGADMTLGEQKVLDALEADDSEAVWQYAHSITRGGSLEGWESIPLSMLAICAYISRF